MASLKLSDFAHTEYLGLTRWSRACLRGMALGGHIIILFYNTRVWGGKARLTPCPCSRERPAPSVLPQVLLVLPGVTLMVTRASSRAGARSRSDRPGLVSMEEDWTTVR